MNVNRREILAACGGGSLSTAVLSQNTIAGKTDPKGNRADIDDIRDIRIDNNTDEARDVIITLIDPKRSEIIFETEFRLVGLNEPDGPPGDEVIEKSTVETVIDTPIEPEEFELKVLSKGEVAKKRFELSKEMFPAGRFISIDVTHDGSFRIDDTYQCK